MSLPKPNVLTALMPLVHRLCKRDPEMARFIQALGLWLVDVASETPVPTTVSFKPTQLATEIAPGVVTLPPATPPALQGAIETVATTPRAPDPQAAHPPSQSLVQVPLKLGGVEVPIPVTGTRDEIAAATRAAEPRVAHRESSAWEPIDLAIVAQRCSLKARACEAAAFRAEAATPEERFRAQEAVDQLIRAARALPDCFLWMFSKDYRVTPDDLRTLRPCYENLARACGVAQRATSRQAVDLKSAVELLAEAQSSLRISLQSAWFSETDRDQNDAFFWLRYVTQTHRIFVQRFMRLDDPADPSAHDSLRTRLDALDTSLRVADNRGREASSVLKKLRYHAARIANSPSADHTHDWKLVSDCVLQLSDLEVVPGDGRLTDALEDLLRVPELNWRATDAARVILQEVAELVEDERPTEDDRPETSPRRAAPQAVAQVREWLQGRRAVLIGGERYPHASRKIQSAFGLAELHWVELSEHGRTAPIDPPIADPDTAVVWAVVKLTGHLHLDVAAEACRSYGRPLVRLPRGYNPSQLAHETIAQARATFGRV